MELRFKELALESWNVGRDEPADKNDPYFLSYLDGITWSMIPAEEIAGWIRHYERKLAE